MTQNELREDPLFEYFLDLARDDMEEADERDVRMIVAQTYEDLTNNLMTIPIWWRFWWYLTISNFLASIVRVFHLRRWPMSRKTLMTIRAMAFKDAAREELNDLRESIASLDSL